MRTLRESFAVPPISIDGEDHPPVATGSCRVASQSGRCKSRAGDHRAGLFQKIASVHGFPFPCRSIEKSAQIDLSRES
jgi:hypothetical protein